MPSSVASAVGSAVASKAIGSIMGGGKSGGGGGGGGAGPGLVPFTAGGIEFKFSPNGTPYMDYSNPTGAARLGYLANQTQSYKDQAANSRSVIPGIADIYKTGIAGIQAGLDKVNPGFGALTDARVNAIRDQGSAADSDLKANLARRRVLGSSFGNADISTQKAEFAKQEADARARSFLEELDATTKLIDQKLNYQTAEIDATQSYVDKAFSFDRAADQVQLDELNQQLSIMTQLISGIQKMAQQNAQVEADYAAQGAANRGQFASGIGSSFGNLVGGFFGGGGETWANGDPFR